MADRGSVDNALLAPEALYAGLLADAARNRETNASHERTAAERCVGIVFSSDEIAHPGHPFFGPLMAGMHARSLERNNDLCLALPRRGGQSSGSAAGVERCLRHAVDGLILLGINAADPELLAAERSGLPTVFLEYSAIGSQAGSVRVDNAGATAELVAHLAGLGYSRIAHLAGPQDTIEGQDRLRGFRHAMERLGLTAGPIERGVFSPESGYEQMKSVLAHPPAPQAVVAASDAQAVGALVALHEAGLSCPEDVALTGFDDAAFAARVEPPLTTIRQPAQALGADAIDALNRMLDNPADPPPTILRAGELVVRESCGTFLRV
ncbi:MAG: LacI family transcriptional regulator [Gaiellaceae bacterium]|nr:LacI family transcriptional regulator [Gaiellaceae bacterium]